MITQGFSFAIPTGVVLSTMIMQGPGVFEGIAVFETLPWREIGLTATVLLGAWLIRRIGRLFLTGTVENRAVQYRRGKTLAYLTLTLTTVFIIAIWVDGLSQIGTFLGLVSAGVAIALKDLLVDFAGWLMLIAKPPFEVGDRIQIGPHSGDVEGSERDVDFTWDGDGDRVYIGAGPRDLPVHALPHGSAAAAGF